VITTLTVLYLAAFQLCAVPAIVRMRRRKTSADLSVWREALLLVGVTGQFAVMILTAADWRVWLSPLATFVSVGVLYYHIWKYRASTRA
jgi:hypothetical protein